MEKAVARARGAAEAQVEGGLARAGTDAVGRETVAAAKETGMVAAAWAEGSEAATETPVVAKEAAGAHGSA